MRVAAANHARTRLAYRSQVTGEPYAIATPPEDYRLLARCLFPPRGLPACLPVRANRIAGKVPAAPRGLPPVWMSPPLQIILNETGIVPVVTVQRLLVLKAEIVDETKCECSQRESGVADRRQARAGIREVVLAGDLRPVDLIVPTLARLPSELHHVRPTHPGPVVDELMLADWELGP